MMKHGPSFELPTRGEVLIGRARSSDIVLTDLTVSRRHAVLTVTPYGILVDDQGATSGTYVNNRLVRGGAPIRVGDVLRLGDLALTLVDDTQPGTRPRRWQRLWAYLNQHRASGRTNKGV